MNIAQYKGQGLKHLFIHSTNIYWEAIKIASENSWGYKEKTLWNNTKIETDNKK